MAEPCALHPLPRGAGGLNAEVEPQLRILAGYADGSLRAWRAADGAMLAGVQAHDGAVRAIASLDGGAVAVTAGSGRSDDARGALCVWAISSTAIQLVSTLVPGSDGPPVSVGAVQALAPLDGRRFAAGCADGGIALWHVPDRTCTVMRGHLGPVWSLVPLPNGELASGGDDCGVRIWNTWDGVCERELRGNSAPVRTIAALLCGSAIAAGGEDGSLRIWSIDTAECLASLPAAHPRASLLALCELAPGRFASSADDCVLALWQPLAAARDASVRWRSVGARGGATAVTVLMRVSAAHAVAGCADGTLRLWKSANGVALAMLQPDDAGDEYAGNAPGAGITSLALVGGALLPGSDKQPRADCGAVRVRDRVWCFAGGSRIF
jgi:WD40 repeat protein